MRLRRKRIANIRERLLDAGAYLRSGFARSKAMECGLAKPLKDGAQGRIRTADTAIFNRMLYQLSYLGTERGL